MLLGKNLGPFLVEKELGSGAMGTVYRAKSQKSGGFVAIKLMALALGSSDAATNRFVREVAILKQLDHPNIVKYKGSGRYHKAPFYIMEYVEGESLDHILARRKKLPWEEVVEIGIHLCAALQHAHDQGIIHRDLKPSNLMILADGTVKLTDFGIAKDTDVTALTNANSTVGTAAYMSPEQCRGARDIGHKSDLYSMGIMFYELLTGKKPFVGETPMEVFLQHANKRDYKRPAEIVMEMPTWLNVLVEQLMEKEIAKRPQNAKAVADSLRLIKEKVAVQRGLDKDATPKRKKDRAANGKKTDADDKDGASAMMGMRKKKEAAPPFYTKGWFTILALGVVLIALGAFAYFAFLRTPDAETLYSEASAKRSSDAKGAREGPIADFLRYYPDHPKKSTVQNWADQYDFELLEKQMLNRRNKSFKVESPEEQRWRDALDEEDAGKFAEAEKKWDDLSKLKTSPDPEKHAWGLIGTRYGAELKTMEADYDKLKSMIGQGTEPSDEFEKLALDARKKEIDRDANPAKASELLTQAREKWEELKQASKAASPRRWHLLASKRLKELK